ncbi:germ cell-less protein-like 1 isoform X2 [Tachyglossus aculeatus]|uniref:germ cell-less protein-like 1 isoform X2 n=1 Tax=Tachyglossus aculeatus TaxID=9261 RepID=UPI0018F5632E|nr:germ cell-less protein-like 1 isoform X2 [Tachyglossus aculeatus]
MGGLGSRLLGPGPSAAPSAPSSTASGGGGPPGPPCPCCAGRKRKWAGGRGARDPHGDGDGDGDGEEEEDEDDDDEEGGGGRSGRPDVRRRRRLLHSPCRKKMRSTANYIYQTLFLNGENSDIKICALGEEWSLHKLYLCQSGYFSSMFCGSWKESTMDVIELEIPDQNIDIEALQVAFGSLYRDDVLIKSSRVISVLAAACMLQLDCLIQHCGETMKETINGKTVCGYYTAAGIYGLDSVKKKCLDWLLNNLMTRQSVDLFKELSLSLVTQLICSSNLFVMQVEMDVYTTLKKWMFLQLVPSWNGSLKELLTEADGWFSKWRKESGGAAFLESDRGRIFRPVFQQLRLQYIVSDLASARIVESDALIPSGWLASVYKQQWLAMLRAEQDDNPGWVRGLRKSTRRSWKGTACGAAGSSPATGRLRLASFDGNGKLICSRTTGYEILTLEKDQEQAVMTLDSRLLVFPLYISCNFMYIASEKTDQARQPETPEERAPA